MQQRNLCVTRCSRKKGTEIHFWLENFAFRKFVQRKLSYIKLNEQNRHKIPWPNYELAEELRGKMIWTRGIVGLRYFLSPEVQWLPYAKNSS